MKETLSGGQYTESTLFSLNTPPQGIAVDGSGKLYISFESGPVWKDDQTVSAGLTFVTTPVGSTSSDSPHNVTLENIGNATLSFAVPVSGHNPAISANFTLDSSIGTCPLIVSGGTAGSLVAGASCTLPVSFTPTTNGSIAGQLTLTDNNLNATPATTQSIALSGTATGAPLTATQSIAATSLTVNQPVTNFIPVTGSGGTAPLKYGVFPALPTGLPFTTTTGAIS
jgi:hypothetical protein